MCLFTLLAQRASDDQEFGNCFGAGKFVCGQSVVSEGRWAWPTVSLLRHAALGMSGRRGRKGNGQVASPFPSHGFKCGYTYLLHLK